ncbi:MAG: SpiroCoCo family coiled-coil protein [Spirochaetaceae bacterium]
MGLFSPGNVIVLLIVLIILAVYRQLDRNNRSLDKVKRYAERVVGDLDDLVQEKATAIRDMGIELEVHQKAARTVLDRIKELEDGLSKRAEQIERIGTRIGDYDTALDELLKMTERAEENLARVQSESEYIDSVGNRLKISQEKLKALEIRIPEITADFAKRNDESLQGAVDNAVRYADARSRELADTLEALGRQAGSLDERFDDLEAANRRIGEETEKGLRELQADIIETGRGQLDKMEASVAAYEESFARIEADYQGRIRKVAEDASSLQDTTFRSLKERIENQSSGIRLELTGAIETYQKECTAQIREANNQLRVRADELSKHIETASSKLSERLGEVNEKAEALEGEEARLDQKIDDNKKQLSESLDRQIRGLEHSVLETVEARIKQYEEAVGYRLAKLDSVGSDIDELETSLRESINQVSTRMRQEFETFSRELAEQRAEDGRRAQEEMSALHRGMEEVEGGLDKLKQQAYENVSEKLQLLEDAFFTDLREREAGLGTQLTDWQTVFEKRLDESRNAQWELLRESEARSADDFKRSLSELQERFYGGIEKIDTQLDDFRSGLSAKMGETESTVERFKETAEERLESIESEAEKALSTEIGKLSSSVREEIETHRRHVEKDLADFQQRFESSKQQLAQDLEGSRSEMSIWHAETLKRMNETGDRIAELESALKSRTKEALDEFKERFEEMRTSVEARNQELGVEADTRMRDFRSFAADLREQVANTQQKLFGKIDDEAKLLAVNLAEIDKRQKAFVEQTKVFDRADALKLALQESIQELKTDLSKVDAQREEIREIEVQMGRIRKLSGEVNERVERFLGEKRRVDSLEDDFKKLMSMSQAVEIKLDQITSSDDELQAVQARLRSLEELDKSIDERMTRLEKKRNIIDVTTEGVDKNFDMLGKLENRLLGIETDIKELPGRVEELSGRVRELWTGRKDVDTAVKQLRTLEATLDDIEGRMADLNSAREWLARTETRLEEVGRDAQDKVKLLASLVKGEGKKTADGKTAPSLSARDTVIKLAHQGWKVEEIARATKVSRGEVELILELATKR